MSHAARIYKSIVNDFELSGDKSEYRADANEPDPCYKSYGVRSKGKKLIINNHKKDIRALSQKGQIELATKLMKSQYGEQQSIALFILELFPDYYSQDRMNDLDELEFRS